MVENDFRRSCSNRNALRSICTSYQIHVVICSNTYPSTGVHYTNKSNWMIICKYIKKSQRKKEREVYMVPDMAKILLRKVLESKTNTSA